MTITLSSRQPVAVRVRVPLAFFWYSHFQRFLSRPAAAGAVFLAPLVVPVDGPALAIAGAVAEADVSHFPEYRGFHVSPPKSRSALSAYYRMVKSPPSVSSTYSSVRDCSVN